MMKKLTSIVVVPLLITIAVSACGRSQPAPAAQKPTTQSDPKGTLDKDHYTPPGESSND